MEHCPYEKARCIGCPYTMTCKDRPTNIPRAFPKVQPLMTVSATLVNAMSEENKRLREENQRLKAILMIPRDPEAEANKLKDEIKRLKSLLY